MKIAIDTNIIIDLIDDRRPGHKNALYLVELADGGEIELMAFADSILTVKYVLRRQDDIGTIEALDLRYEILHITDTKAKAVRKALRLCKEQKFGDIEDVAKLIGAEAEGCELFVTNDKDLINLSIEEIDIVIVGVDEILSELGYFEGEPPIEKIYKNIEELVKVWQKNTQNKNTAEELYEKEELRQKIEDLVKSWKEFAQENLKRSDIIASKAGIGEAKTITNMMLEAGYTKEEIEKMINKKDE